MRHVAVVLTSALVCADLATQSAHAVGPGKNGRLLMHSHATTSSGAEPPRLEWLNPDGTGRTTLREGPLWTASLAPGGTSLVAGYLESGRYQLRRLPADGSSDGTLLAEGSSPLWSPDGTNVAFNDPQGNVAIIPADGGQPRVLLPRTDLARSVTDWSPDGRRLVAVTEVEDQTTGRRTVTLETIAADGSDRRPLDLDGWEPARASWSPDGTRFVAPVP